MLLKRNRCLPSTAELYPQSFRGDIEYHQEPRDAPAYSTNGQCGPANNNLLCDPSSTVYTVSTQ